MELFITAHLTFVGSVQGVDKGVKAGTDEAQREVAMFALHYLLYLYRSLEIEPGRQNEAEPPELYVALVVGGVEFNLHNNSYCRNKNPKRQALKERNLLADFRFHVPVHNHVLTLKPSTMTLWLAMSAAVMGDSSALKSTLKSVMYMLMTCSLAAAAILRTSGRMAL